MRPAETHGEEARGLLVLISWWGRHTVLGVLLVWSSQPTHSCGTASVPEWVTFIQFWWGHNLFSTGRAQEGVLVRVCVRSCACVYVCVLMQACVCVHEYGG